MNEFSKRNNIVMKFSKSLGLYSSFGVTGSTVNGIPNKLSDIDLFVIINPKSIKKLVKKIYNLQTFQLLSNKVLSYFEKGRINVIFYMVKLKKFQLILRFIL